MFWILIKSFSVCVTSAYRVLCSDGLDDRVRIYETGVQIVLLEKSVTIEDSKCIILFCTHSVLVMN